MLLKLVVGAAVPAVVGFVLVLLLVSRGLSSGDRPTRHVAWVLPVVMFGVFAVLQPWIAGKFVLVPRSASEWALPVAAFGLVFALINAAMSAPGLVRVGVRFVLLAGIGTLIARTFLERWTAVEAAAWLGAFAALTLVAGRGLSRIAMTQRGVDGVGVLALFTMAAAAVCEPGLLSLPAAQYVGIVAWLLCGASLASLWRPSLRLHHASVSLPVLIAMGVVFASALTTGDTPLWMKIVMGVMLPAIPGLALAFDRVRPAHPDGPRLKRSIARLAIAAIPLVVIAVLGGWQALQAQANTYEY
jgi:hypothetical protein